MGRLNGFQGVREGEGVLFQSIVRLFAFSALMCGYFSFSGFTVWVTIAIMRKLHIAGRGVFPPLLMNSNGYKIIAIAVSN